MRRAQCCLQNAGGARFGMKCKVVLAPADAPVAVGQILSISEAAQLLELNAREIQMQSQYATCVLDGEMRFQLNFVDDFEE